MDQPETAVSVHKLDKIFKLPLEKQSTLKSTLVNFRGSRRNYKMQDALKNINFEVKKGEFFGIIGRNGSGKSTLLKLLAGIYYTSKGSIKVNGSLTPFIELGVGFNPELTGRENIYLNGALLGFSRKEMRGMYNDIVEFAELEQFMDQKLKNYSSGMQVRLAFSIAIRAQSDILLIDEVLAVGDAAFQQKCYDYFRQLKKESKTVVFVSHDLNSVQEFCDRAAIIDGGTLKDIGGAKEIVRRYETILADRAINAKPRGKQKRPGTGDCIITDVRLLNSVKKKVAYIEEEEPFAIEVSFNCKKAASVVVGVAIIEESGVNLLGPNTQEDGLKIVVKSGDKKIVNTFFPENKLSSGTYSVTAAIFKDEGLVPFDYYEQAVRFKVLGEKRHGKINSRPKWSLN